MVRETIGVMLNYLHKDTAEEPAFPGNESQNSKGHRRAQQDRILIAISTMRRYICSPQPVAVN